MELERGAGNGWVEMFSQSSLELSLKVALEPAVHEEKQTIRISRD